MRQIFFDDKLEQQITQFGYCVIPELLSVDTCDLLSAFYEGQKQDGTQKFFISNWNNDTARRQAIHETICQALQSASNSYLDNYKPVMGVFSAKLPEKGSAMDLHQDWSIVDETKFRSVSIWLALCDTNNQNGNLQVAEGSHDYAGYPRGINPSSSFEQIKSVINKRFLTDIPLKKGSAIVFDHRLIHASPENETNLLRLAAVLALIPADAELIHYYQNATDSSEFELLKLDEENFHLLNFFCGPAKPSHQSLLQKASIKIPHLTVKDIEQYQARTK